MMLLPDVNPKSFIFFFERGDGGASWSLRDYSIRNRVKEYGLHDFRWTAVEIHQKAQHSLDAPTHSTGDLSFWHEHTNDCNKRYLKGAVVMAPVVTTPSLTAAASVVGSPMPRSNGAFPILNLQRLLGLPKDRKSRDMERILRNPNSEDWVTWNFFQVMLGQYPKDWWGHMGRAARRCNIALSRSPSTTGHFPHKDFGD